MPRTLRIPALVLVAYGWFFPWLPGLRSPNELSRLYQARAIVEDHTLSVNGQIARYGPVGDLSVFRGRYHPNKAPGVSFLGAAAYLGLRTLSRGAGAGRGEGEEAFQILVLRLVVCVLPAAVAAELLRRILARRFEERLAAAGALAFALGTIFWPYSTFFVSHGVAASAVIACWWAIERRSWFLSGLFAGTAVLLEYTSAVALVPLGAYALWTYDSRRWGAAPSPQPSPPVGKRGFSARCATVAVLGFLPPIALLAAYHQLAFGHPLHTGYRHLVNATFTRWHARGFMGVGAPSFTALAGSFLDPYKGLFLWCPFLALGVPGLWLLWRRPAVHTHPLALLCAGELALYALFTASFTYQAWGWTVGPRHITTLCAFLVPPALAAAGWLRDRGAGWIAAGLALAGVALLAVTMAVCPYLPEELSNPVWQLVVPLARQGLRSHDLLGLALGVHAWWTLLPWLAVVGGCAGFVVLSLAPRRLALSLALAAAFLFAHSRLGGNDSFEATRRFMAGQASSPLP